jgi:outer membrane protein assembly factor BamB
MKAKKRQPSIIYYIILWISLGGLVLTSCTDNPEIFYWAQPITEHRASVPELWSRNNIFISQKSVTQLIATIGKVIFIGSAESDGYPRVIALDEISGKEVWEYKDQNAVVLTAANDSVYVGEVGFVTALNSESGNVLWSTPLPFSKSVTKLVAQDGLIYVDAVGANYYLLDMETGTVLQTINYEINNNLNPSLPIWSEHRMDLELSDNAMYFQKQTGMYPNGDAVEITAMDKLKNQIWSTTLPAVSRISVNSSGGYILTLDGTLMKLNLSDGHSNDLVEFTPPPILSSTLENGDVVGYGYYVAVNEQMFYIYFGDSAQLFAFRIQ